jgi:hypothetical protein
MDESLLTWIAAIESEYATPQEWIAWADNCIERLDEPPLWVLDLAMQKTHQAAFAVLQPARWRLDKRVWEKVDSTGMIIGFLFLRFERGDVSMLDLLLKAGEISDCANYEVGCETFYLLANEIDRGGPITPSNEPLLNRVTETFRPLAENAMRAWVMLNP